MFVHCVQTNGEQSYIAIGRLGVTEKVEFVDGVVRELYVMNGHAI